MKLFFNVASPYARRVIVTAHEKGLICRIEMCEIDPWSDPAELHAATPVGKVPALVTDDGVLITESALIGEYLDDEGEGPSLLGPDAVSTRVRAALAQGLIDAAFAIVIEGRRPADRQWPDWVDRQRRAIDRVLPRLAVQEGRFDLDDIALASGLGYLDFRLPDIGWRASHPRLADWLDGVNQRPSMIATAPR